MMKISGKYLKIYTLQFNLSFSSIKFKTNNPQLAIPCAEQEYP